MEEYDEEGGERTEERVNVDKGRFRGERLQVGRLIPRLGEQYGEDGADPG